MVDMNEAEVLKLRVDRLREDLGALSTRHMNLIDHFGALKAEVNKLKKPEAKVEDDDYWGCWLCETDLENREEYYHRFDNNQGGDEFALCTSCDDIIELLEPPTLINLREHVQHLLKDKD